MNDAILPYLFYFFAGLAVLAAFCTISQHNPVRSVLFLVLTFFASAVLWLMLQAEFLALILILVYVGAVMTLFLFVVMMLNIDVESKKTRFRKYAPFGLLVVALLSGLLLTSLPKPWALEHLDDQGATELQKTIAIDLHHTEKASNTKDLGLVLYTDYFLAFELAALLLLVAIISAITLTHRTAKRAKRQSVIDQMMTDPKDRLTLVKMKSE